MKPIAGGLKPLCDTCNRNNYPCRCPRASHEIVIGCQDYIQAHGSDAPVKFSECPSPAESTKSETATDDW
ncbi:hypothetical protein Dform_01892 [Dehalogenimonas formicexedens]|uniref:Uncharacterized protein n=1 Tax=Dehalogenimonas formicexedens TaxID=1839801 RepID=A0A1P8F9R8_9CHLR|nr:hypothetical protein [Dehalogenimonas formicexedens]APV45209.1 hypothetical protein Dform_01892 [Dehalogenimonas formicexedens]